ncbi:MAG TPA: EAL domain-containing protein, partial [Solirubrobacterales bacterium]|nr:EAL domain-containing protein [Solirubrobacterales bacterium]
RFVLDDFGSGLSSFAYLKNLAVDFLKIDGEFVRGMVGDSVQRALVESIHQIGHVMGIQTIAESVENQATLAALRTIGVDYAQGYEIAAPEPLV